MDNQDFIRVPLSVSQLQVIASMASRRAKESLSLAEQAGSDAERRRLAGDAQMAKTIEATVCRAINRRRDKKRPPTKGGRGT